jgi:hypothetical protein
VWQLAVPPWDAQALDDEAYQLMLRSYRGSPVPVGPAATRRANKQLKLLSSADEVIE